MMTANQMGQPQKPTAPEHQLMILGRFLQSLREAENIESLIKTTITYLQEQFDYSLIWIGLYDHTDHRLFGQGGVTPKGDISLLQQRFVLSPGDLLEQVVMQQRPAGVADLRAELRAGEWGSAARSLSIQGTIIFPICHRDHCFGVVLLGSERWGISAKAEEKARLQIALAQLGAMIQQIEISWQHSQIKRSDEPLLRLLEKLRTFSSLEQKLVAVVEETHQFLCPTRTNIYWFEREKRYFWCRVSNRAKGNSREIQKATVGFTVQEVGEFYQALAANQIVVIGEAHSSLKANLTDPVLQKIRARSLLAYPILVQNELLGFLALEGNEARIWTDVDKNFVTAAAGLISLVAPLETMETTIQKIQGDAQLASQVVQAICSDDDAEYVLRQSARQLLERFGATRFLLLQYDSDQSQYEVVYQSQPHNRRPLAAPLDAIANVDWHLLQHSPLAVGIENIEHELVLYSWRVPLLAAGVRSLLIANCRVGNIPEALVVITHEATRAWTGIEKELLHVVSQQLGAIVRQWQLHSQAEQQQKILHSFQHCLQMLEQTYDYQELERTALQNMGSVLKCPLVILLCWSGNQQIAEIIPGVIANSRFAIESDAKIVIQNEALIQWTIATDGVLTLSVDDLPADTRQWFSGADIGQVLAVALRTSSAYEPTGVVLLADHRQRQWPDSSLSALQTLVYQLAWSRRHLKLTDICQSKAETLSKLNWYKHRRFEDVQRSVWLLLEQLNELGIPRDELTHMRYQQLLRQLGNTTMSMTELIQQEEWGLLVYSEVVPIATLLKRSLERIDNLVKLRKLWMGVHGLGPQARSEDSEHLCSLFPPHNLAVSGDIVKIELIIHELLLVACQRSHPGGRIDIWCRSLDQRSLELSITDNGTIEPQLLEDLHTGAVKDLLVPSTLNQPPGLNLMICKDLMHELGGALSFYQLLDGRIVSRLLLPLATGNRY